jgi:hypothetical protein
VFVRAKDWLAPHSSAVLEYEHNFDQISLKRKSFRLLEIELKKIDFFSCDQIPTKSLPKTLAGNVSKIGVHACNHKSEKTLE